MSRAIADTSVFIAREADRPLGDLPDEIAVSVITAAELELGVLRARDPDTRATRTATLARVRGTYPLLPIDAPGEGRDATTHGSPPPRCATTPPSSPRTKISRRSTRSK
jgi:hypothetical protein